MESNIYSSISCSFLGKFIGDFSNIVLSDNAVLLLKKDKIYKSISIEKVNKFAIVKKGIFGSRLTLSIADDMVSIQWLKTDSVDLFMHQLNKIISKYLDIYLRSQVELFYSLVDQYPRDSQWEEIQSIYSAIYECYFTDTLTSEKYLSDNCIALCKSIESLHPIQIEEIRSWHEEMQLKNRKAFFDSIESNPLTQEQRLAVIRNNDLNMVLAAAGTGKTSVIVAKTLDLINRNLAKPEEILVLAYNNLAAKELKERLFEKAEKSNIGLDPVQMPHISTFHALGRKILQESGIRPTISIFSDDTIKLKQWVSKWLYDYLSSDSGRFFDFIQLFPEPVNPFNFQTQAEYEAHIRDNEFRTLNGEKVKGFQELLIANFLYLNGIEYIYEDPYVSKRRIEENIDYRPDFHIKGTYIYIEHFGIDRAGNTRTGIDAEKYNSDIILKRELHRECETILIETFHYEWIEETLHQSLKEKLIRHGLRLSPIPYGSILKKLHEEGKISIWSELFLKALQAIRVERLTKNDIIARLNKDKLSNANKITNLLDDLHQAYVQELISQNSIDFDDMIIRAINVVAEGGYAPHWRYVLVDEFQDISSARMEFVKTILEKCSHPSLTVVGDDWQAIYRFSGGKLELTTRFDELVGSCTSTILQKTFRYNNSIAKTAGQFIMENPEQKRKNIKTHTHVDTSQIFLLDDRIGVKRNLNKKIIQVVSEIRGVDRGGSIAIIARYNYLLHEARELLSATTLKSNILYWSYHKSKGLEADYAILIGFFQGSAGFPNENKNDAIIEALLPSLDGFPHSEERRLLYVGITRAKKQVYIIADPTSPSQFIMELLAPKYELNIVSNSFNKQYQQLFKCPNCCEGYLQLINGHWGDFYSCSTGLGCPVRKARICEKCGAPSVDHGQVSVCNNPRCSNTINICEKCGRPMRIRTGKFGEFWGCSGYGIPNDKCNNTRHKTQTPIT